jgi:hypothetical protein
VLLPAVPVAKNDSQLASAPMQRQQHGHTGAAVMERVAVLDLETTGPSSDLGDRPEAERCRQPAKADAARQVLARNFSSLFASVRPMAVGTGKVLEAERKAVPLPCTCIPLKRALFAWSACDAYLEAVAAGAARLNLAGEAVGEATPEHLAYAARTLKRRRDAAARQHELPSAAAASAASLAG